MNDTTPLDLPEHEAAPMRDRLAPPLTFAAVGIITLAAEGARILTS